MEAIEQDLELAWRGGFVDLSIVHNTASDAAPERTTDQRSIA
jgi:hypothetical protein